MKTLGLVLAMVALVGGSCLAQSTIQVSIPIVTGATNLITLPCVPIDPAVGGIQSGADTSGVFGQFKTNTGFALSEWTGTGYFPFNVHNPSAFGNLLLGTGYYVSGASVTGNVSYVGLQDGVPDLDANSNPLKDTNGAIECTDMYISLPGSVNQSGTGGTQLVGLPFNHSVAINSAGDYTGERILFTDGTTTQTWGQAVAAGWVLNTVSVWSGTGYTPVGYGHGKGGVLYPGKGFFVTTLKDNLAMIIPGKEDGLL